MGRKDSTDFQNLNFTSLEARIFLRPLLLFDISLKRSLSLLCCGPGPQPLKPVESLPEDYCSVLG